MRNHRFVFIGQSVNLFIDKARSAPFGSACCSVEGTKVGSLDKTHPRPLAAYCIEHWLFTLNRLPRGKVFRGGPQEFETFAKFALCRKPRVKTLAVEAIGIDAIFSYGHGHSLSQTPSHPSPARRFKSFYRKLRALGSSQIIKASRNGLVAMHRLPMKGLNRLTFHDHFLQRSRIASVGVTT